MPTTSEVYKKLYHYTTWGGMLGILEKDFLWATHYNYLNDCKEITLFKDTLIDFLYPYTLEECKKLEKKFPQMKDFITTEGGLKSIAKQETVRWVNIQYNGLDTTSPIHLVSFCGEHQGEENSEYINQHGLLSQWRGYGRDGGFALVFDTAKLEALYEQENNVYSYGCLLMADLVYSHQEEKLKTEFAEDLQKQAEFIAILYASFFSKNKDRPLAPYYEFIRCISRYKHRGFCEENEVRLITCPSIYDEDHHRLAEADGGTLDPAREKKPKLRDKNGERVPYIELFDSPEIKLPIEKIIVGPHKDKEARAEALRMILRDRDIEVTVSDIPYVG